MEFLIPIGALTGLYYISNDSSESENNNEGFSNFNNKEKKDDGLENPDEITSNYPVATDEELRNNSVNRYPRSIQRTDKYFSKNVSNDKNINHGQVRNTNNIQSLSGNVIKNNEFKHNNMVPFFGSKIRGNTLDYKANESILDNMVGSGSQTIEKKENAPLFKPTDNIQYANGAPNMNDFFQSRVNQSNKISNVKPWKEQQVAPGLKASNDIGDNSNPGYNSGLYARNTYEPKNVDDLRVKTNPKISFELKNHEGPASYYIKNPNIGGGKMEKNRPETTWNLGSERYFTTTGVEKKPTVRSMNDNIKLETINEMGFYNGTQSTNGPYREHAPVNYRPSDKCDAEKNKYLIKQRNYTGDPREGDYGLNSIKLGKTNRDCNPQYTLFSGVKGTIGALFAPIVDVMRPSKKEDIVDNYRVFGNATNTTYSGFNENTEQSPNVTNRDMNINNEEYFGSIQKQHIHSVNNIKHQINNQQRETTTTPYSGVAGGSGVSNAHTSYTANYNQTNNETKEYLNYSRINPGNAAQFNNKISMTIGKSDNDRCNNRSFVPSNVPQMLPPSYHHMGVGNVGTKEIVDNSGINRMQPDILDAFKKNPYTHSIHSTV
tara:strand:- start:3455 stop:5263 length:1809 start_codon:yes stop_codon:yes gene_type:complete